MTQKKISKYPEFIEISPKYKEDLEIYNIDYKHYCTFSFSGLINWSPKSYPTKLSILNNNLIIKTKSFTDDRNYYSFVGNNEINKTIAILLNDLGNLSLIPEEMALKVDKSMFTVTEDTENMNFVIDTKKSIILEGHVYKDKRRQIRKFLELYPDFKVALLNPKNSLDVKNMMNVFNKWELVKGREDLEHEAFENFLKYSYLYETLNIGIYIKDQLIGFTINDVSNPLLVDGMFGKDTKEYKYVPTIYEYYTHQLLYLKGFRYINLEMACTFNIHDDKFSWNPIRFLRVFNISKK